MKTRVPIIFLLLTLAASAAAQVKSDPDREKRIAWWREARFGMLIHWGLYALPAGEWKGKPIPGLGEWIMNRAKIPVAGIRATRRADSIPWSSMPTRGSPSPRTPA